MQPETWVLWCSFHELWKGIPCKDYTDIPAIVCSVFTTVLEFHCSISTRDPSEQWQCQPKTWYIYKIIYIHIYIYWNWAICRMLNHGHSAKSCFLQQRFAHIVEKNFVIWGSRARRSWEWRQHGGHLKEMTWLSLITEHLITSFHTTSYHDIVTSDHIL